MPRYENRTAVITGGSTGIGLATAQKLVEEGARVLLTGRDPDALRTAQEMLGGSTVAVASDAASLGDIGELAERAHSELGELDLLFVNAGITRWIPFSEVEAATTTRCSTSTQRARTSPCKSSPR